MTIVIFIIILAVLILSHELGHFLAAKWSGVKVFEFGIGFPPRLARWKIGETIYSINLIPFGGFVKMLGEDAVIGAVQPESPERNFAFKPKSTQALILVAGVLANLILAWFLISVGYLTGLPSSAETAPAGAALSGQKLLITYIEPGSPAQTAGLKVGETIVRLEAADGSRAALEVAGFQQFVNEHQNEVLKLTVREREGKTEKTVAIKPSAEIFSDRAALGVGLALVGEVRLPPARAFFEGAKSTAVLTSATAVGLYNLVSDALSGRGELLEAITGPVGIVGLVGGAAALGFVHLLVFTAVISINLAIINLIPFPALDGGRLLFLAIEAIKGSPIKPRVAQFANAIGFALLILLMIAVTYNDIVRLVG